MKTDIDWQAYVQVTRREYIKQYGKCAKKNSLNFNVLRTELDNILEAANRAGEQKLYKVPLEIVRWLWVDGGRFLDLQGYIEVSIQLLTQALDAAILLKNENQQEELLGQTGRAWLAARDLKTARQYFQRALQLAQKLRDTRGMASHLGCLGQICLEERYLQDAEDYFKEALSLAKKAADRQLEGRLLGSLGLLSTANGHHFEAIRYFERAKSIAQKEKDWQGKASHLGAMGIAYKCLGDEIKPEKKQGVYISEMGEYPYEYMDYSRRDYYYKDAKKCFEQAMKIAEKMGDKIKKEAYEANIREV